MMADLPEADAEVIEVVEAIQRTLNRPNSIVNKSPSKLEDLCVDRYLSFLEDEAVTYISLTQSKSKLIGPSLGRDYISTLKRQLNSLMSGVASGSIREKMLEKVISSEFPSARNSRLAALRKKDDLPPNSEAFPLTDFHLDHICSTCVNTCCAGSFIQETMAGIIVNSDVRTLCFNSERMSPSSYLPTGPANVLTATPFSGLLPLNAPLILQHLIADLEAKGPAGATAQLQRLVFSEAFVREEPAAGMSSQLNADAEMLPIAQLRSDELADMEMMAADA